MAAAHFGTKIARLRVDNGGEYTSNEFKRLFIEKVVQVEFTVRSTPEQNGVAERLNRTLLDKARTMVHDANLSKSFWSEALYTAVYTTNRSPTRAFRFDDDRRYKTPAELWSGKKPDISKLRIFGCTAYSHIPKEFRKKLDSKTTKLIMVGYAPNGYRLWDGEKRKIVIARDVIFDENIRKTTEVASCENNHFVNLEQFVSEDGGEAEMEENRNIDDENVNLDGDPAQVDEPLDGQEGLRRSNRARTEIIRYPEPDSTSVMNLAYALSAESFVDDVPTTIKEAESRSDWIQWKRAIEEEMESLKKNNTWTVCKLPEGRNPIPCKWVFKIKYNEDGEIDKYKARLVAKGFLQKKHFDYEETFAPVAKLVTLRVILAVANQQKYYIHQMDVKSAFLNGDLNEKVYMQLPEGFKNGNLVCLLNRSLYGLRQAAKMWNKKFNDYVIELGFVRSYSDYCVYIKMTPKSIVYLLLYVDDLVLAGNNLDEIKHYKRELSSKFEMKDLGDVKYFLGLKIEYDMEKGILQMSQRQYMKNVLKRFQM